ncbi:MAG: bifunctional UDP-N-acetylglucosamine diphosphorylase/glucosamine-1-phosphate N-acetyltransferase GlmU [Clostridiales bacterium]|nr:bifunctional UDP-N-acetylglucosamine diphosphorylase/glucosamine-1-phosphate N-acetyltransferase GlmU [Clostridiales bacterium]
MEHFSAIILAAGKGTRMKSSLPKVLHPLLNKPILQYVVEAALDAGIREQLVVVGHEANVVEQALTGQTWANCCRYVYQEQQLGTGHALLCALPKLSADCKDVLVLCGDTPLISADLLKAFIGQFAASGARAAVLTARLADPAGYGRIVLDEAGDFLAIVEEKEASEAEKTIREINSGIYCFKRALLKDAVSGLNNANAKGEYYLTDILSILRGQGQKVLAFRHDCAEQISGINDRVQLAQATLMMQNRVNTKWMLAGVTIIDPSATYIDTDVQIGRDTVIEPQTYLRGKTIIGNDCHIGVGSEISNSKLGNNVYTRHAIIVESEIGNGCDIGPFTYIRPGSKLHARVKAGHFVELKKAEIGSGSKVPHLSYIGDAVLGCKVNIGCGTITCNYDGQHKYTTTIGDEAFIGSNTNFIAPVSIGARAIIGAGSTITQDVPADALAIERAQQKNIPEWAIRNKNHETEE